LTLPRIVFHDYQTVRREWIKLHIRGSKLALVSPVHNTGRLLLGMEMDPIFWFGTHGNAANDQLHL